ncbi:AAA family ATPase [Moraxella haemolytica]|uniref:AAA family ATPase n=1 Tax=Moraxella haemolytica TaxID=2904119 RepID=UPI0025430E40|nr:AAA family ATPase [Moraxella sp. ZY171148]WII94566.1 AAA family ATPase [Moraxella sp. ZY171148]
MTTITELETYLNGSSRLKNCVIDGVDFGGGYALPLLDFTFAKVGYKLITKDKTGFIFGNDGDFMGVCDGIPILTDNQALFLKLLEMGVDCVYSNDINSLVLTAEQNKIPFKIASTSDLRLGFKKHLINIPQGATKGRILSLINGTKELVLTNANDIEAKPIQWLWQDWLPLGKLTVFAGAGGAGKTNILLNLIATISNGGVFPDGTQCTDKGEIIIYSTEDDISDTIKPRLMANSANLANINFITAKTDEKGELVAFTASEDLPLLYDYAQGKNIKLLMIDPIISAIDKDMNKANDVRNGLQILVDFAQDFNCAVVGITHFAKGSKGASPADRIIGSQAFTALSRMSWVANRPDEPEKPCIFTRAKSNISELDGGFEYHITPCEVDGISTTKIEWGNFQNGTAKELLNEQDEQEEKEPTLLDEAKAFLVELLREHKEMKSSEVQRLAKEADITTITLRRAREIVCDRPYKKSDGWYWRLKHGYQIQSSNANLVDYGEPFPFT